MYNSFLWVIQNKSDPNGLEMFFTPQQQIISVSWVSLPLVGYKDAGGAAVLCMAGENSRRCIFAGLAVDTNLSTAETHGVQ